MLASNTDVVVLTQEEGRRYFFVSTPRNRPLGIHMPTQCQNCGRLKSLKWRVQTDLSVRSDCMGCKQVCGVHSGFF
jgi:hypothetical protein